MRPRQNGGKHCRAKRMRFVSFLGSFCHFRYLHHLKPEGKSVFDWITFFPSKWFSCPLVISQSSMLMSHPSEWRLRCGQLHFFLSQCILQYRLPSPSTSLLEVFESLLSFLGCSVIRCCCRLRICCCLRVFFLLRSPLKPMLTFLVCLTLNSCSTMLVKTKVSFVVSFLSNRSSWVWFIIVNFRNTI